MAVAVAVAVVALVVPNRAPQALRAGESGVHPANIPGPGPGPAWLGPGPVPWSRPVALLLLLLRVGVVPLPPPPRPDELLGWLCFVGER